jgi:xanthine dehydrogenase accessory factor
MNDWLKQLTDALTSDSAGVMLVSVLRVAGSVPRYPGARMLVTDDTQSGTIGGGHLEFAATRLARERLRSEQRAPQCEVFHLGPTLGQCCGGRVELLFEYFNRDNSPEALLTSGGVRRAISGVDQTIFEAVPPPPRLNNRDNHTAILEEADGTIFLTEPGAVPRPSVWLFGAGHVGTAVVAQLSLLPCAVTWIDERDDMFPDVVPDSVTLRVCDDAVSELADAADDTYFVVMTHSHALDFELCHAIMQRSSGYLGLIGSATKRAQFEKRLRHRGVSGEQIARLVCPIGSGGLQSGEPNIIALSLALQLVQYWQVKEVSLQRG